MINQSTNGSLACDRNPLDFVSQDGGNRIVEHVNLGQILWEDMLTFLSWIDGFYLYAPTTVP